MTTLTLTRLWVNLLTTGESLSAPSAPDKTQDFSLPSFEVRSYANGRRRAVSTVGDVGVLSFTLLDVPLVDKDRLRTWKGLSVQVRDNRGQKWYGAFGSVGVAEEFTVNLYAVTFTLLTTSVTEGV